MKKGLLASCFVLGLVCAVTGPAAASGPKVVEVTSSSGIKAWLVEDHKLPLISMRFAFRGGVEQDPVDKQGLAILSAALLTQGAGPYDDRTFQERLAAQAISLDIDATRDEIDGHLKTLVRTQKEAFHLLALALTRPRFDDSAIERLRDEQLTSIKFQLSNPGWQGRYALFQAIYGQHPYSYRSMGTPDSLQRLTRSDIVSFVRSHLARDNLTVSVVGAIDPETLRRVLDEVFKDLPQQAVLTPIADVGWANASTTILVKRQGKQTDVLFARPMMKRDDPDWYAAEVANYILGGGGFTSRLMKAVRAKKGLTYGVETGLSSMDHASLLMGSFSSDNAKTAEAMTLLQEVWQTFYDKGVTQDEVDDAKAYMIGALPISLTSTDAISATLLAMQTEKLGIDYLDRHASLFEAVTKGDVDRVIRTWFDPARISASFVGAPEGLSVAHEQEMVKE